MIRSSWRCPERSLFGVDSFGVIFAATGAGLEDIVVKGGVCK